MKTQTTNNSTQTPKTYIYDLGSFNVEIVAHSQAEAEEEIFEDYPDLDYMELIEVVNAY